MDGKVYLSTKCGIHTCILALGRPRQEDPVQGHFELYGDTLFNFKKFIWRVKIE